MREKNSLGYCQDPSGKCCTGVVVFMKRLIEKEERFKQLLGEQSCDIGAVYCFDKVESTMDVAFDMPDSMVPDRTFILAESQIRGRGRFDRQWHAGAGSVHFSFILIRFDFRIPYSMAAAFAVYRAFRHHTDQVKLKWVNDVLWRNEKKVSGILTEERGGRTVMGIGVNLNNRCLPPLLREVATSYYLETGCEIDRDTFTVLIVVELLNLLTALRTEGIEVVLEEWEAESGIVNQKVKVVTASGDYLGVVQGIHRETGALILLTGDRIIEVYDGSLFYCEK